jgi:lipoate-protein ligase A
VDVAAARRQRIQLIKRFTGGGTVVVDHDTIFTSLIFQVRLGQTSMQQTAGWPSRN